MAEHKFYKFINSSYAIILYEPSDERDLLNFSDIYISSGVDHKPGFRFAYNGDPAMFAIYTASRTGRATHQSFGPSSIVFTLGAALKTDGQATTSEWSYKQAHKRVMARKSRRLDRRQRPLSREWAVWVGFPSSYSTLFTGYALWPSPEDILLCFYSLTHPCIYICVYIYVYLYYIYIYYIYIYI